jgi:hypothetical protein
MTRYNRYDQKPNSRKSVADDRKFKALPPGKRVSKKARSNAGLGSYVPAHTRVVKGKKIRVRAHFRPGGQKYTEHRQNRSDHPGSRL